MSHELDLKDNSSVKFESNSLKCSSNDSNNIAEIALNLWTHSQLHSCCPLSSNTHNWSFRWDGSSSGQRKVDYLLRLKSASLPTVISLRKPVDGCWQIRKNACRLLVKREWSILLRQTQLLSCKVLPRAVVVLSPSRIGSWLIGEIQPPFSYTLCS